MAGDRREVEFATVSQSADVGNLTTASAWPRSRAGITCPRRTLN